MTPITAPNAPMKSFSKSIRGRLLVGAASYASVVAPNCSAAAMSRHAPGMAQRAPRRHDPRHARDPRHDLANPAGAHARGARSASAGPGGPPAGPAPGSHVEPPLPDAPATSPPD